MRSAVILRMWKSVISFFCCLWSSYDQNVAGRVPHFSFGRKSDVLGQWPRNTNRFQNSATQHWTMWCYTILIDVLVSTRLIVRKIKSVEVRDAGYNNLLHVQEFSHQIDNIELQMDKVELSHQGSSPAEVVFFLCCKTQKCITKFRI